MKRKNPYTHRQPDLFKTGKESTAHAPLEVLTDAQVMRLPPGAFSFAEMVDLHERLPDKAAEVWAHIKAQRAKKANSAAGRKAEHRDWKPQGATEYHHPEREALPTDFTEKEMAALPEEYITELGEAADKFIDGRFVEIVQDTIQSEADDAGEGYSDYVHELLGDRGDYWWENELSLDWLTEAHPQFTTWDELPENVQEVLLDSSNWDPAITDDSPDDEHVKIDSALRFAGYIDAERVKYEPVLFALIQDGFAGSDAKHLVKGIRKEMEGGKKHWSYDWEIYADDYTLYAVFNTAQALDQIAGLGALEPKEPETDTAAHIMDFDDGWYVVELTSDKAMKSEGKALKHCVGTEANGHPRKRREGRSRYFSLRKPDGQRVITIEAARVFRPGATAATERLVGEDALTYRVVQALGYLNRSPGDASHGRGKHDDPKDYKTEVEHMEEFEEHVNGGGLNLPVRTNPRRARRRSRR